MNLGVADLAGTLANSAIALSFVAALVFGILQTLAARRDRKERLTVEVLRAIQTKDFARQMVAIRDTPPPTTAADWEKMSEDKRITFLHFSQEMEMLGLLAFDNAVDVDLVERTLGTFVTTAWGKFRPVLEELRVTTNDPYLAEYFQWLAARVEERMRDRPRKPAFLQAAP